MSPDVRVAVVGFGLAGRVFHCPFVSAVPGLQLHTIVQRSGSTAAELYPLAKVVHSPQEAFADPEIDLVVVATPNDTHEKLAIEALRAGKHVVVDKPVAGSSAAIRRLMDLPAGAQKLLIPFHNRRWDGDFLTVQQLLREDRLGELVSFTSQWDRFRPVVREGTWKESPGEAHGLLLDLGPHLLDQALVLFGTPQHLTASVRKEREGTSIEDAWEILLTYGPPAGRLRVVCRASMIAADAAPRFRLNGVNGSFTKYGLDPQEAHLVADGRQPPRLDSSVPWIEEPEAHWGHLTLAADPAEPHALTRSEIPTATGDYRLFYAGVRDAILGKAMPPVAAADALRVAQLLELARESSASQRTLEVRLN